MKSPYLSEIQPNQVVTATFLVQLKDVRQKKTGEPYLSLILADRTGELDAKMWDNVSEVLDTFERDDFVKVRGLVQIFHNRPQLTIHRVQRIGDNEVDFADYFPASAREPAEMFAELRQILGAIRNPHLKALVDALLDDEEIARRFRLAPAAKSIHHACLGGLLEHVLSLSNLALLVAPRYPIVDLDLVLTGVVVHDIGKITELTYDRSFAYSSEGQLLGHIVIGLGMVADKLRGLPDFPPRLRTLVEHMIVSHHGELEFGSPKAPQFPEAMLLHHLDNLDSKMENMRAWLAKDRHVEGCWTGYSPLLERAVLKKVKYLDESAPARPADSAAPEPKPPQNVPATSGFAAKLQEAWNKES